MNKKYFSRLLFLMAGFSFAVSLSAQMRRTPSKNTHSLWLYDDATQLWRTSNNAAGLGRDTSFARGVADFSFQHKGGSFHRVQEGDLQNALTFSAERFQPIGKYLHAYGRFDFDMGRVQNRAWSDVLRTYNSNPYISGSPIAGRYDWQNFAFDARLGTVALGDWTYGLGLKYKVGDFSRLRDPRSRINLLDYQITPAITFATNAHHTFGLAAYYHRRKEKLPNISTVQSDANLFYYELTGLENATGSAGGYNGFQREWVNHEFGFELSNDYRKGSYRRQTTLSMAHGTENVYEAYKAEPGRYYTYTYGLNNKHVWEAPRRLQTLEANVRYEQGYADEFRQQQVLTTDSVTKVTSRRYETLITFKKRYQVHLFDASVHYRYHWMSKFGVASYLGGQASYNSARNKHLLYESSLQYGRLNLQLEGGKALLRHRLWLEGYAGYNAALGVKQSLADATTDYAKAVLLPDMQYHRSSYGFAHLQATYQFPLTIKGERLQWFARAQADYLRTNKHTDGYTIGLSIGIIN